MLNIAPMLTYVPGLNRPVTIRRVERLEQDLVKKDKQEKDRRFGHDKFLASIEGVKFQIYI